MKTQNTLFSLLVLFGVSFSGSAKEQRNHNHLEIDSITYLEEEDSASLDFDTTAYLPEDFNPYSAPSNVMHISYISGAGEVELGFDTKPYLPRGFNPNRIFFDIHSIEYIEEETADPYTEVQRFLQAQAVPSIGR